MAMSLSGSRTVMPTRTLRDSRVTGEPSSAASARTASRAEALGATLRSISAPQTGSKPRERVGPTAGSASASPGRFRKTNLRSRDNAMLETVFELGKVFLKVELSKQHSGEALRQLGGTGEERIVLQKIAKFWNQQNMWDRPDGLVVVTNFRLVFLSKVKSITARTDHLSFPFDTMEGLKTDRIMGMSPAIRFTAAGKPFVFTFLAGAQEVYDAVAQFMPKRG